VTFLLKKLRIAYQGLNNNNSKINTSLELNNTFSYYSDLVWSSLSRIFKMLKNKSKYEIDKANSLRTHVHLLGAIEESLPEFKTYLS